jgi:pheromone shutdown-related protein TraB
VQHQVNERLLLVGTAHVSRQSVEEVEAAISSFQPDVVAIELDPLRLDAIQNKRRWEDTPIHKFLKGDKLWLFLTQVLLASYQRRLGDKLGVEPGAEMLAAVNAAQRDQREIVLADRDIGTTMKRAFRGMRWREKFRLTWQLAKAMVGVDKQDEEVDLEQLMQEDVITQMMTELGDMAPSIKTVLIDERDEYLAEKIRRPVAEGKKVVAVVGAGHLNGIKQHLAADRPVDLEPLETVPEKRISWGKIIGWGIPMLFVVLLAYFAAIGFKEGNWDKLRISAQALLFWGGGLAALGALVARGHPYSVVTAFLAAPLGILHPGLATGWFSGLVEAWKRTPVVKDFEGIALIKSGKEFWGNRVIRVLMVAALTNVGAMIGGFIALGKILSEFPLPGR